MTLRTRSLGKRIGGRWVLRDTTCDVPSGTWLGVLGPNGAGKTTLLRLLATVLAADEGGLYWRGAPVGQGRELRRHLGYLPQTFALPPLPTVGDGSAYLAALKGIPTRLQAAACERALRWADLDAVAGWRPERLSSGMLRRVGLAQAVLGAPTVLLLDEPDRGADPEGRSALRDLLRAFANEGRIVVSAAHDPDFLEAADRVLLPDGGRAEGPVALGDLRRRGERPGERCPDTLAAGYRGWRQQTAGRRT